MKEQKVLISKNEDTINEALKDGWYIKSVTPQNVSTGSGSHLFGSFIIVLERNVV